MCRHRRKRSHYTQVRRGTEFVLVIIYECIRCGKFTRVKDG